ncbi:hypothetical protein OHS70_06230 [Streptomyces sp. NBC_00390]|uniref:hypothetical protein n=1 Tax=Streptomyces sp. NBC_00390 TaxID=2975736 RepID=UPI002E2261F3
MMVHQLPADVGVFARYLKELVALLDRSGGWYGIFWQRDPDGMQACLDGVEIPPWDVVESLLQDLAAERGPAFVQQESVRASRLQASAAAAHDRLPGGREALAERLELMLREQTYAQGRAEELIRLLGAEAEGAPAAEQYAHELSWTRDDHVRATARIMELRSRQAALARPEPPAAPPDRAQHPAGAGAAPGPGHRLRPAAPAAYGASPDASPQDGVRAADAYAHPGGATARSVAAEEGFGPVADAHDRAGRAEFAAVEPHPPGGTQDRPAPEPPRAKKRRRPRGARFAGVEEQAEEAVVQPVPVLPVADDVPRGARFGGAAAAAEHAAPAPVVAPAGASRSARETVAALGRLRAEGRGGEAHAVICEAAARPASWLPALAGELHRSGLAADWATLLWEVASQPAARLAAAADALAAAGRSDDGHQLLRQGVSRSADEIAGAVIALEDEGLAARGGALLAAFVQVRSAEDAARVPDRDPARLVPQVLAAARAVSTARERDVVHALRVAGHL